MSANSMLSNDDFQIVKLTKDLFDQAVDLFMNFFLKYENISIATNLLGSEQTRAEMKGLLLYMLEDNVSFAATIRETNIVVGICINKIVNPSTNCTVEEGFKEFSSPNLHFVGEFIDKMENTVNIHTEWNIDCSLEIMFLSIHNDYGGRGIGVKLVQHSIEYARALKDNQLDTLELNSLPLHVRNEKPKAVTSVFTSLYSQKIGKKCGLQAINTVPYSEVSFEGKTFAESIGPIHKNCVYAAMKL